MSMSVCTPVASCWSHRIMGAAQALVLLFSLGCASSGRPAATASAAPSGAAPTQTPHVLAVRADETHTTAVVFVHGIFGDSTGTWTSGATKSFWPRIMHDDEGFNDANIYVVQYHSAAWQVGLDVEQTAQQLHWVLQPIIEQHQRVVFVCHSLGGIVVREYLLQFNVAASRVPLIYFFGTPSQGAELAVWARLASPNAQLRQLVGGNRSYLDKLGDRWINGGYGTAVKSYCAYEDPRDFPHVVTPQSAKFHCNAGIFPLLADHLAIVKPEDAAAPSHQALVTAYREVLHRGKPRPTRPAQATRFPSEDARLSAYNKQRPAAPTTVSASAICLDGRPVNVFATSVVEGATHYILHRNGVETFHMSENPYIDRDVMPGMPYTYFAQACDAGGCGPALPYKATATALRRCNNRAPQCRGLSSRKDSNTVHVSALVTQTRWVCSGTSAMDTNCTASRTFSIHTPHPEPIASERRSMMGSAASPLASMTLPSTDHP